MEGNQNSDRLPLDLWGTQPQPNRQQQLLASALPAHQGSSFLEAQSIRNFVDHRQPQAFTYQGDGSMLSPPVDQQSVPDYSMAAPAPVKADPFQGTTGDRSAWSRLLSSLDPSMSTMSFTSENSVPSSTDSLRQINRSGTHNLHSMPKPLDDAPLSLRTTSSASPVLSHPTMGSASLAFSATPNSTSGEEFGDYPRLSSQEKASLQLSQLMNLSKNPSKQEAGGNRSNLSQAMALDSSSYHSPAQSIVPKSLPKTTANHVPSLESSGYSPVSPPSSEPMSYDLPESQERGVELLQKEGRDFSSTTEAAAPGTQHSDFFSYFSEKLGDVSSTGSFVHSNSLQSKPLFQFASSETVLSPSDVPLDMTTAFSSKGAVSKESMDQCATTSTVTSVKNGGERIPLLQSLLTGVSSASLSETSTTKTNNESSTLAVTVSQTSTPAQPVAVSAPSQEKTKQPVKSTPKKSNFYGRDASLFSFVTETSGAASNNAGQQASKPNTGTTVSKENQSQEEEPEAKLANDEEKTMVEDFSFDSLENKESYNSSLMLDNPFMSESDATNELSMDVSFAASSNSMASDDSFNPAQSADAFIDACSVNDDVYKAESNSYENDAPSSGLNLFSSEEHSENVALPDGNSFETPCAEESSNPTDQSSSTGPVADTEGDGSGVVEGEKEGKTVEPVPVFLPAPKAKPGPKRRKRKNAGFQARQRKRGLAQKQTVTLLTLPALANTSGDTGEPVAAGEGMTTGPENVMVQVSPVIAVKRKRGPNKPKTQADPDAAPRRSSSRRSKDNAMRLIELQADSNYGYSSQPPTDPSAAPPAKRPGRPRKTAAAATAGRQVKEAATFEDVSASESDEEGMAEKDDDYVVDEEEAAAMDTEDILLEDADLKKKKGKEKKSGGLKISFKLSSDSSVQIVSGIGDSPVKKRKRITKQKLGKKKIKSKEILEDDDDEEEEVEEEEESLTGEVETKTSKATAGELEEENDGVEGNANVEVKHQNLMEKYFSSATSAIQMQKAKPVTKGTKLRKRKLEMGQELKGKKVVMLKGKKPPGKAGPGAMKKQEGRESKVRFEKETESEKGDDKESSLPKFVCGYCPKRYHSKQDLWAHMETHLSEMEGKQNSEGKNVDVTSDTSLASGGGAQDPRATSQGGAGAGPRAVASEKDRAPAKVNQGKEMALKKGLGDKQKFSCGECGQVFKSKAVLLDHVRIHTAEKPFECDICHKCFKERNMLSVHRKGHIQERLLRCQVCSKAFVHKADLERHMQSHPKRSSLMSQAKPTFKSMKKSSGALSQAEKEKELPDKKPKSFALALGGVAETTSGKNGDCGDVLVLKRGDGPSSTLKNAKDNEKDNKGPSKTSNNSQNIKTLPKQGLGTKNVIVSIPASEKIKAEAKTLWNKLAQSKPAESTGKSQLQSKSQGDNEVVSNKATTATPDKASSVSDSASAQCHCKECPECVTRFLSSFD